MSWSDLFPGCCVRWEDDRPFEVEVSIPRTPDVEPRIVHLLRSAGWAVVLAPLSFAPGSIATAMVLEASPIPCPFPSPKVPS